MTVSSLVPAVAANAYANLLAHARQGHVWWRRAIVFALAGTIGAGLGSSLGLRVDGKRLLFLFGLLMAAVGLLMLRRRVERTSSGRSAHVPRHRDHGRPVRRPQGSSASAAASSSCRR